MRSSHSAAATRVRFDDPTLVSAVGLVPLLRLAENIGLADTADDLVRLGGSLGANPGAKITTIVAGMCAGADSITDLDQLRHGAMHRLFEQIKAPSTIGSFLRWFSIGHTAQLEKLAATALCRLATRAPLLPDAHRLALLDLDSTLVRVYGRTKTGAKRGYQHLRGLDVLAATLATPGHAPVIVASRLRGGNAHTARHITSFATRALATARAAGATGTILVRGDSGYYQGKLLAALTAQGAQFSVTARQSPTLLQVITAIEEANWTPITFDTPVHDEHTGQLIHTAQLTETRYTAFTKTPAAATADPAGPITARLIVRRTPPAHLSAGQGELFPVWRYHAIFTTSTADTATAHAQHSARAGAIEQVFTDLHQSALAHLPSAHFAANAAWLTLAALAHNLTRAAAVLAGGQHTRARAATLRRHLITIPARVTRTARTLTLRLPEHWPWQPGYQRLFTATHTRTA